ncbi:ABC transporter substrate-binding protein [Lawsonibacter celer]|jgi:ABC-type nitrate/sulfonate/bicarbonate transport system substrate-binding protein|uniref:ABC transporter substrate-binding protein n=1 Tax=Lawsonibacter celer TaxID=2986526 RepID=UPI001648D5AB|nr:ABC transporter substrate-binding protein [Lawsonibacter celer]
MKKLLATLLAGALAVSLAACGNSGAGNSPAPSSSAPVGTDTPAPATGEPSGELRTVKMCLTRTAEVLEDTPFWVAENLGYLAEEGLKLEMIETIGTTDCKMVATGQADFAVPGPSLILQSIEQGLPIKVVCAYDAINIWGLCVLNDSPYQTFEDMKDAVSKYGHKLTVALGDASWESLVTPTLVAAGIDPAEDLEFVVAGDNRYVQVAEGALDILFTWPGEAYQLIGQGYDFKYIDGNDVLKTNSNSIITNTNLIANEPEVVEGYVRALCKGIYFTKYNPEAAAAVSCDQWPNIDITWKAAVYVQEGRNYQMFGPEGGEEETKLLENIGISWEDKWQLNVDSMLESGVISTEIPVEDIFTNDFVDTTWDRSQVEADADAYDWEATAARYEAG